MSKNYSQYSRKELIEEIKKMKRHRRYGLVWDEEKTQETLEKNAHDKLPMLKEIAKNAINAPPRGGGSDKPTNILIEGDNYHALSVLNYTHGGGVGGIDAIYIDPPYNTGREFMFNDRIVDGEDSYRHSKWISFMNKRLRLAKKLLSKNGIIFISIDDHEQAQLRLLCDEIFGEGNFITNIVWLSKTGSSDAKTIDTVTEYVLVYTKNKQNAVFLKNIGAHKVERFRYKDKHVNERGKYYPDTLDRGGLRYSDSLNFPIKCPDGQITYPNGRKTFEKDGWTWKWGKDKVQWGIENDFIVFRKSKTKASGWTVSYKNYLLVNNEGNKIQRSLPYKNIINEVKTGDGAKRIKELFGHHVFKYTKPVELITMLLSMIKIPPDGVILDFFAGTGTTGEAVLELNRKSGGNRKFILCTNNENNICTNVCHPRLRKVMKGYRNPKDKKVEGLGGNLKYFKTDFVDFESTDQNKMIIVKRSTEMLCLKEDCFELVNQGKQFSIFRNNDGNYLGIVYYYDGIEPFRKQVIKLDKKITVYVFSLSDAVDKEEFQDVLSLVDLKPIPSAILNAYRRIFRHVK